MATQKTQAIRDTFQIVMGGDYVHIVDAVNMLQKHIVNVAEKTGKYEIHQPKSNFYMRFNLSSADALEDDVWELAKIAGQSFKATNQKFNNVNLANWQTGHNPQRAVQFLKQLSV
jgi:hypothetical protein